MKILVEGQKWKITLLEGDAFIRRFKGENASAYTLPNSKEICFNADDLSIIVVRHELGHAYYAEQLIGSADLDTDQAEEVWCDILAERGPEILKLAKKLHAELKKLL